ncbi:MAG: monovalent cation/H+ antiporter subunit D family protein [Gammaproteobacteria bacterium]|nr:monovalent cation/H+ antiporter subunit D family protein [Gammaproteobacteria bacterium]
MNPVWALVPPLAVIPFILIFGENRRNWREGSIIVAGLVLLWINNQLYNDVMQGTVRSSGEIHLLSQFSLRLQAEPMGVVFGLVASLLWIVTTVYSIGYMRGHDEKHQTRFYVCFAICLSAVMAAAYSANLLTLFVAYEVITLSTFPLVIHAGHDKALAAGRLYLGLLMASSIGLFLPAIIWTANSAGTLDFVTGGILANSGIGKAGLSVLLALFVFGIAKAATMPFHRWLPAAMVAPTPVSALLHAVAVVKTGVFSLLKIVTYIFGIDVISTSGANDLLLFVAGFTVVVASVVAFTKDNLKARLAYSTIGQLAYIVLAALLATEMAVSGGVLHIVMHAFGKITLFFCAGAILVAAHRSNISELDGIGRVMPLTMAAFFIGSLSIIGLPPAGGVWSKLLIAGGSFDTQTWIWAGVLMLSTVLNIAYLIPISLRAFFQPFKGDPAEYSEAPFPSLWAIMLTSLCCVLLFFFPAPITDLINLIQWR